MCYVKAQLPFVYTGARAYVEILHLIFVVAYEDERRSARQLPFVRAQTDAEKGIAPQDRQARPEECAPLAVSQAMLNLLPLSDDAGVKTQA